MSNIFKVVIMTSIIACFAVIIILVLAPKQNTFDYNEQIERRKCVEEFFSKAKSFPNTILLSQKQGIDFETICLKVQEDTTLTCDELNYLWSNFQTKVLIESGAQ
jgi:hypothetical protein